MIRRGLLLLGLLASVMLAACATTDWEEQYNETHALLLDATQERDEAMLREEQLRQDVAQLTQELNALRARPAADPTEVATLRQRLQEAVSRLEQAESETLRAAEAARNHAAEADRLRQENAELKATRDDRAALQAEVDRLIRENKDAYLTDDGNIEIRLSSDVTFASGEATLTRSGQANLRGLRDALTSRYGSHRIRVEGHTDNQPLKRTKPKWGDNLGLGSARALSVTRFMESELGIEPGRLEAVSHGEHFPVADNGTKAGRAKNRRVSIVVVIPPGETASMAK